MLTHVLLFGQWTVAYQAPWPMEFSRQEYWSGLPLPSPGDLPYAGMEPASLVSPALAGGFFTTNATWQEYLSGLPLSSPVDLPDPGIEPVSPALAGGFFTTEPPGKPSGTQ